VIVMRKLAPLVLSAALAATVVGAAPAQAVSNNGCNYPPGAAHSVIRNSADVRIVKRGQSVNVYGQTKAAGGRGCPGAFVQMLVADGGGAYHLYHPTPRTNGVTSGSNGYFSFNRRVNTSFRYYFTWAYSSRAYVISTIGKVYVR
jgi:hypothetical protein